MPRIIVAWSEDERPAERMMITDNILPEERKTKVRAIVSTPRPDNV